jgi:hypothetical protein
MSFSETVSLCAGLIQALVALLFWFGIDFKRFKKFAFPRMDGNRNKVILVLILGSLVWSSVALFVARDYRKTDWMGEDPRWKMYKKQSVVGRHFSRENVQLDGKHYIDCTFEETTLVYDAQAPYELTNSTFVGTTNFKSGNARIGALIVLMHELGMLPKTEMRISPP